MVAISSIFGVVFLLAMVVVAAGLSWLGLKQIEADEDDADSA